MSNLSDSEVQELLSRFLKGEEQAFTELVRKYQKKAYYFAYRFTHNHQDAEDLSQEAFIHAYRSLKKFKSRSSFFTWFYRILVNLCINFHRRRSVQVYVPVEDIAVSDPDALSIVESKELGMKIHRAIEKLPLRQKAVFILRQIEELSFEEVSESMGCSVGAAKASYFQAVRKLQKYLKGEINSKSLTGSKK